MNRTWSDSDIDYLRENYPTGNINAIADHLGRTSKAIKSKAKLLGIKREVNKKHSFTPEEDQYIIDHYADVKTELIARHLNLSIGSIYNHAHSLGLKKSLEFLRSEASGRTNLLKAGMAHRYQKGHIPANKGQKMSPEVYEKCSKTMFRKGNKPHNTRTNGEERITKDGYIEVKIQDGVWKLKHRIIWEANKEPIPEGQNIVFKDRNPLNCEIANLEMISNQELMERNTMHRFPENLKKLIRTYTSFNRQLNKIKNE